MFHNLFKKDKKERSSPGYSAKELTSIKKKLDSELRASLYFYNNDMYIVCSIAEASEYGEPTVLDSNVSDENIGLVVCDKLLEFRPRSIGTRSKPTLDDWSAYKVSGAKSGKAFEQKSIFVYISTVNTDIHVEVAPRVLFDQGRRALCTMANGCSHSEIGAAIRKAIDASILLCNAGAL